MGSIRWPPGSAALRRAHAAALGGVVSGVRRLEPAAASDLGGWLGRTLGPSLPASRVADGNLRRAMPELDAAARADIVRGVWDNLGRTIAELPHLPALRQSRSGPGWELQGAEHLAHVRGRQALFFSGHFGNWEMVLPIASQLGLQVSGFYRAASNAGVDALIQRLRQAALAPGVSMFAKGAPGARAALRHLGRGLSLGLLVDQKMNDGIAAPFFGRPAMTAPALAHFALRFRTPVAPVRVVRLGPARFRMVCEAPLQVGLTGRRDADAYALTLSMNQTLERWIREAPASWLWLHRRWPKPGPD